jgi:hypothetical protein
MSEAYAQCLLRCINCTWFVLIGKCFLRTAAMNGGPARKKILLGDEDQAGGGDDWPRRIGTDTGKAGRPAPRSNSRSPKLLFPLET